MNRIKLGTHGKLTIEEVIELQQFDPFTGLDAPEPVNEWMRTHPEEVMRLGMSLAGGDKKRRQRLFRGETTYRTKSGKYHRIREEETTEQRVRDNINAKIARLETGGRGDGLTPESLFTDAVDYYLGKISRVRQHAKQGSRQKYIDVIERSIRPPLGRLMLMELTTARVNQWLDELGEAGKYSDAHMGRWLLADICRQAKTAGGMSFNPVDDALEAPRKPTPVKAIDEDEMRLLTIEEVDRFRRALLGYERPKVKKSGPKPDPQMRRIFEGWLATGCRPNELLACRVKDVDLDGPEPRLTIAGTIVFDKAKEGGKLVRQPTPKKADSYRSIALTQAAALQFRRQLDMLGRDIPPDALLFRTRSKTADFPHGTPFGLSNVMRTLHAVRVEADIEEFFAYMLRKGAGNALYQATGDDKQSALLLGHSGVDIWKKHYKQQQLRMVDSQIAQVMEQFMPILDEEVA